MDISDIKLVNRLKADLDKREEDEKERRAELFPELVEALEGVMEDLSWDDCACKGVHEWGHSNLCPINNAFAVLAKAKEE